MAEFSYAEQHIKEELGNDKSDQNSRGLHQFKSLYFDREKCIIHMRYPMRHMAELSSTQKSIKQGLKNAKSDKGEIGKAKFNQKSWG